MVNTRLLSIVIHGPERARGGWHADKMPPGSPDSAVFALAGLVYLRGRPEQSRPRAGNEQIPAVTPKTGAIRGLRSGHDKTEMWPRNHKIRACVLPRHQLDTSTSEAPELPFLTGFMPAGTAE